jgi:hypothetical protein
MRVRRLATRLSVVAVAGMLLMAANSSARAQGPLIERVQPLPLAGAAVDEPSFGEPIFEQPYGPLQGETWHAAPPGDYFDYDAWTGGSGGPRAFNDDWHWQLLPDGIIYQSYLAGAKESRLGTQIFHSNGGTRWDSTVGGRAGLLRFGTFDTAWPQGWQLDVEGSGQVRVNPDEDRDVDAMDFRAGGALTYGYGPSRWKFAYYHLCAHVGDEFLLKDPSFDRLNYVRDAFALGYAYFWTDNLRLYSEASWAFYGDFTGNWHFQFGLDYAPARPTGIRGAPFFAINGHLRQELNYGGNLSLQSGWAWRGESGSQLLRAGLHYYNGASNQYSFFRQFEHQIGAGMWYDF